MLKGLCVEKVHMQYLAALSVWEGVGIAAEHSKLVPGFYLIHRTY